MRRDKVMHVKLSSFKISTFRDNGGIFQDDFNFISPFYCLKIKVATYHGLCLGQTNKDATS